MNCLCDSPILPLIILFSCCGKDDGIGGLFGCGSSGGLDQLLWLLCILCMCGSNGSSCGDRRY